MNILALIPARSGSKGIPHKNIRMFGGMPLLAHSIQHGLASRLINRVIVSTDSPDYADIARQYGAETPFLRPPDIAQDLSTDLEVFTHALTWLCDQEGYKTDILVHLRPTCPIRRIKDIDAMIQMLLDDALLDSVRSVALAPETPFKMWFMNEKGNLEPVIQSALHDPHNMPRQALPPVYLQNAAIDVVRASVVLTQGSTTGRHIRGYLMPDNFDIDTELQFATVQAITQEPIDAVTAIRAQKLQQKLGMGKAPVLCFDIDGVIANITPDNQYDRATPCQETVQAIQTLYRLGCFIILFTARGTMTGINWQDVTRQQMKEWDVPYHELLFGKPAADYYIDDKLIALEEVYQLVAYLDRL